MRRLIHTHFLSPLWVLVQLYSHWQYWFLTTSVAALSITIAIFIPTFLIPGNSTTMVLALMQPIHYLLISLLAFIAGTLVSLNIFMLQQSRLRSGTVSSAGLGTLVALAGSIFASSCGCGVGFVFGFLGLGLGGVTFLIAHQVPIMLITLCIAFVTLYSALRSATKHV